MQGLKIVILIQSGIEVMVLWKNRLLEILIHACLVTQSGRDECIIRLSHGLLYQYSIIYLLLPAFCFSAFLLSFINLTYLTFYKVDTHVVILFYLQLSSYTLLLFTFYFSDQSILFKKIGNWNFI
jgi:hypothetical protein